MPLSRILVADDEESMRWVLSKALRKKGFTVDLAKDGEEALRLIQADGYDLAILDIKMPGVSGLSAIPELLAASPATAAPHIATDIARKLANFNMDDSRSIMSSAERV